MTLRQTIGLSLALLVASTPAMAKHASPGHHHPAPHLKTKAAKAEAAAHGAARHHRAGRRKIARSAHRHPGHARRHQVAELPPPDRYIGPFRAVGRREVGAAAWYGGRHLGRRTASGERLDAIHVTAAHRSLPLHSLVRVTNLKNGRSVIATINDRGPVSRSLLIDVSPRAAEELHMIRAGVATVSIQPVAPAPNLARAPRR
jgi:peptidoglycan lytic transglycosylase